MDIYNARDNAGEEYNYFGLSVLWRTHICSEIKTNRRQTTSERRDKSNKYSEYMSTFGTLQYNFCQV
jgi:hypothetical protein